MTTAPSPATAIPDDVFAQMQTIDRTLAHAVAELDAQKYREAVGQLLKAQALSHSLLFRLESERLQVRPPSLETAQASLI